MFEFCGKLVRGYSTWMTSPIENFVLSADGSSVLGGRDSQEDRFTIVPPDRFSEGLSEKIGFFAVYDGHGGADTADFASQKLHTILKAQPSFQHGDYKTAIRTALAEADKQFFNLSKLGEGDAVGTGSTVALCLVNLTKNNVLVANLGDSHILIGEPNAVSSGYSVQRLSKAHKPEDIGERARIESAGGMINNVTGQPRVGYLNMSRALGDQQYKKQVSSADTEPGSASDVAKGRSGKVEGDFVSVQPHIATVSLAKHGRSILLLASDGVTDKFEDEHLIAFIQEKLDNGWTSQQIAQRIVENSSEGQYSDNCTCIVVVIDIK